MVVIAACWPGMPVLGIFVREFACLGVEAVIEVHPRGKDRLRQDEPDAVCGWQCATRPRVPRPRSARDAGEEGVPVGVAQV